MFIRTLPMKTVSESGGDPKTGTGWLSCKSVPKDPSEWTEAERDYMVGRDPKIAPLQRRIADLEAALAPFAALADQVAREAITSPTDNTVGLLSVRYADLRRAAAALRNDNSS